MRLQTPNRRGGRHLELKMTPMIDVVFLLLIFFIMTFQIVAPEGDLNVKMPPRPTVAAQLSDTPLPILVRLEADDAGRLAGIHMQDRKLPSLGRLQAEIREIVASGMAAEVELDCDGRLEFEHTIDAITAVSGYVDGGRVVRLIDKIRFSPP